jgi:hypothetical protein
MSADKFLSWNEYVAEVLKEMLDSDYREYNLDKPATRRDALIEASRRRCAKDPVLAAKAAAHRKKREEHTAKRLEGKSKAKPEAKTDVKVKHKINMSAVKDEEVIIKAVESSGPTMYDVEVRTVKISKEKFKRFQETGVVPWEDVREGS